MDWDVSVGGTMVGDGVGVGSTRVVVGSTRVAVGGTLVTVAEIGEGALVGGSGDGEGAHAVNAITIIAAVAVAKNIFPISPLLVKI